MQFGRFGNAAREDVIMDPKTPYPWINELVKDASSGGGSVK
jgi:cellobiose phosphorylase